MGGIFAAKKYSPAKMVAEKGVKAVSPAAMLADEMKDKDLPAKKVAKTGRDARKKMIEEIEDV